MMAKALKKNQAQTTRKNKINGKNTKIYKRRRYTAR